MQNILLAAGLGRRSNGEKLLLPYKGEKIVTHAVRQSLLAGLFTIVVTGFRHSEVTNALQPLCCANLKLVHNSGYAMGQGSSTAVGAKALRDGEDFFISLADMPLIRAEHYKLLAERATSSDAIRPIYKGEVGHPVLLKAGLKGVILEQKPPFTMRSLLKAFTMEHTVVDDRAFVYDIDTVDAYDSLLAELTP